MAYRLTEVLNGVLIDLDGVLRRWPENQFGTSDDDRVRRALFDEKLLQAAITGRTSDAEWRQRAAASLTVDGRRELAEAVAASGQYPGELDLAVVDLVDRVRRVVPVVLATNATSVLDDHLDQLRLRQHLDAIINSSNLGVAKPSPAFFSTAMEQLGWDPASVLFVDDTMANVVTAESLGCTVHLYRGHDELASDLTTLGLLT
jgi:putative hydrolase of the HAD superfamily